jgi:hypothetical protein
MVEPLSRGHEDAIGFRSLLLSGGKGTGRVCRLTLDGEVVLPFGLLVDSDEAAGVLAR